MTTKTVEKKTNLKWKIDAKKKAVVLEIPLEGYSIDEMLEADLSDVVKFPRSGANDKGCDKEGNPITEGNIRVASTRGIAKVTNDAYKHLRLQVNFWAVQDVLEEERKDRMEKADLALARKENSERLVKDATVGADAKLETLRKMIDANPAMMATLPAAVQAELVLYLMK
ncbi:hypothetical protein [Peribacillus frigoritolerans]|uniref:Uncharacterized protein n=1 Tax=Peribacillus castrilensis TaxID=2897690 RepID=A0AAW9NLW5_9BACI|nr:hypothetical protein [Peribacillus castrilensis]